MGQIVVNVGSFDLTSHNGNTAYSSVRYFDIPANAGITGCVATFATHVNTGSFQGKSFSLNGAQAHPNTPWPTSGIALNTALLSTGQNTFRAAVKSQAGLSARWSIGDIYLTITYTEGGGGGSGGGSTGNPTVSPMAATVGTAVNVSIPATPGRWFDAKWKFEDLEGNLINGGNWGTASSGSVTITEGMMAQIPSSMSGTMIITVREFDTPTMPYNIVATKTYDITINVPASAIPTIGTFTATRDNNGVDASITKYVQNYSKVNLAMGSVAGALGSTIAAYEITGGGFSAAASSAAFGPFAQTGDITFTAKVTDTRGRTATRTVTINVLSYGPPAFSNPEAWRSSDVGVKNQKGTYALLKSGLSYSSLDGQNAFMLKGRVYPKGGTAPAYTNMTPDTAWITGGGLLLVSKTYIAQMTVQDKITLRMIEFTIPTKKTGISIMAGMQGIAFGKSVEIPGVADFAWPIYSPEGACPGINDIIWTLNSTSPATRFPGTAWAAIGGRFLIGADGTYAAGSTGGAATHTQTLGAGYAKASGIDYAGSGYLAYKAKAVLDYLKDKELAVPTGVYQGSNGVATEAVELGGSTDAGSSMPPYLSVYIWKRTA